MTNDQSKFQHMAIDLLRCPKCGWQTGIIKEAIEPKMGCSRCSGPMIRVPDTEADRLGIDKHLQT